MGIKAWGRHSSGVLSIPMAERPCGVAGHGAELLRGLYPDQQ